MIEPGQPGYRTAEALGPILRRWLEWAGGKRGTFHTAQVVTGHGCFGDYLRRIGREPDEGCFQCGGPRDSAQHTLAECPTFAAERQTLSTFLNNGGDLALSAVMRATVGDDEKWRAFIRYCEVVMRKKEEDERVRRGEIAPPQQEDGGSPPPRAPDRGRRRGGRSGRAKGPAHLR